jgi:hypothetical protein
MYRSLLAHQARARCKVSLIGLGSFATVPSWVESNITANEKGYRRSAGEAELAQFRISEPKEFGCILFSVEDFSGYHAYGRV